MAKGYGLYLPWLYRRSISARSRSVIRKFGLERDDVAPSPMFENLRDACDGKSANEDCGIEGTGCELAVVHPSMGKLLPAWKPADEPNPLVPAFVLDRTRDDIKSASLS